MSPVRRRSRNIIDRMSFCTKMQMEHMLEDREDPVIEALQVFGHRVHHGHYSSQMSSVWADTVASVWRDISETHLLEVRQYPRNPLGSHIRELNKRLYRILRHYGFQDPLPWHEKSVPLGFMMVAVSQSKPDALDQCMADLLVIALFFCLCYC